MPYAFSQETEPDTSWFAARAARHRKHPNRLPFPSFDAVTAPMLGDHLLMAHLHGHNHRSPSIDQTDVLLEAPTRSLLGGVGLAGGEHERNEYWRPESAHQRMERHNRTVVRQCKLAVLCHTDPLFERTMRILEFLLHDLPLQAARDMAREMDTSPNGFMRHYKHARTLAEHVEDSHHRKELTRQAELTALKRKVKSGKAQNGDLLKYLELSGFGDILAG